MPDQAYEACQVAPQGWWCHRPGGHDGPCAAHPVTERSADHDRPAQEPWPGWDTPPTWPEGTVPSIEETALWLGLLTPPDRVRFAQRLEEVQRMASECFQMDHLGCIERQASVLEARLPQWWSPDGNHYWAPTGPPPEYPWGLPHRGAE